jgi:hypothetical protein
LRPARSERILSNGLAGDLTFEVLGVTTGEAEADSMPGIVAE